MITCITCRDPVMAARFLFNCSPILSKVFDWAGCKVEYTLWLEYITDQLSGSWLLYDAPPCVLRISHFFCTFVVLLYLVISDAQYSKFVHQCVCSPVKWVTISQCKGDLARTTLMDKIPLKLWRWEELVLVDGKKFPEICIQLPVHFFPHKKWFWIASTTDKLTLFQL